jgi:hypothetical protein
MTGGNDIRKGRTGELGLLRGSVHRWKTMKKPFLLGLEQMFVRIHDKEHLQ